jgi:diguanylate cyclase (GGDEF)-like protein
MGDTMRPRLRKHAGLASKIPNWFGAEDITNFSLVAVSLTVVVALTGSLVSPDESRLAPGAQARTVVMILLVATLNTEAGRWVEGRLFQGDRPNKSLSVWAMCCALTVSPRWLLVVVPFTYTIAYWRGMRLPPWKWIASASAIGICAVTSGVIFHATGGNLDDGTRVQALVAIVAALAGFVIAEAGLLGVFALVGDDEDEQQLRDRLRSVGFYTTEVSLLCVGAVSIVLYRSAPWFVFLMLPIYVISQQAAIVMPLRAEAQTDDKTGLLRYETWRLRAAVECGRYSAQHVSWVILFIDIDHFKKFNDTYGHASGDVAISWVGETITRIIRSTDMACRFGGEEFLILAALSPEEAEQMAARLQQHLDGGPGHSFTVSVGIAAHTPGSRQSNVNLSEAMQAADQALYRAKETGRDRVVTEMLP